MSRREKTRGENPKRPKDFGSYRSRCIEGRFRQLEVIKSTRKFATLGISDCGVLWNPAYGKDILPVHAEISSRFVNRGFACAFASVTDYPNQSLADTCASLVHGMADAGVMPDVLTGLDRDRLLDGGMAMVDQSFIGDALLFGLTSGAYAPAVYNLEPCRERISRYLRVFPQETEYEVIALDPELSTWFWNDWIDFFFCVICPSLGWAAIYAGSDTD